jgi:hypothetical protein
VFLYQQGVVYRAFDGIALNEKAVTLTLELSKHVASITITERDQRTREANIVPVGAIHTPHTMQVASLTTLLTGEE